MSPWKLSLVVLMLVASLGISAHAEEAATLSATSTSAHKDDGLLIDKQRLDKLEKMSADERNVWLSKRSAKLHHLTSAQFDAYKQRREAFYKSLSPDENKQFSQRFAKVKKDWFNGLSGDQKKKITDAEAQREKDHPSAFKHHHDDKTVEEKPDAAAGDTSDAEDGAAQ